MPDMKQAALDAALAAVRAAEVALVAAIENQADADPWLALSDASDVVPVPRSTLERWAREGRLQAVTAERGRLLTRRSWLDAAIAAKPYTPRSAEDSASEPDEIAGKLRLVGGGK